MTFKQYLIFMSIGTAVAVVSWVVVVLSINPVLTGVPGQVMFYVTTLFALLGLITLIGTMMRVLVIHRGALVSREVARAFRHAVLLSLLILVNLFMASVQYLRWWSVVLSVLFVSAVELFFLTAKRGRRM